MAMVGIILIVGWGYDGRPREWQGIALGLASGIIYRGRHGRACAGCATSTRCG